MTTLASRHRYLAAIGLSIGVVAACSANEGATTPVATTDPPEGMTTGGATVAAVASTATPTATSTSTATTTSTSTSSEVPESVAVVQNGVPTGSFWSPTISVAVDLSKVRDAEPKATCPSGQFCTTEAHARGKPSAPLPYAKCAASVTDPKVGGATANHVSFDPDQTKLERAAKKDACCYTWEISCPGARPN